MAARRGRSTAPLTKEASKARSQQIKRKKAAQRAAKNGQIKSK